jgi:cytochrome c biogenesis protein CcmG/thiol:disulfide interchange protein DsbE
VNDDGAVVNDDGAIVNDAGAVVNDAGAIVNDAGAEPRRRLAPFVTLAVALVMAGLVVVLATSHGTTPDSAATPLIGQPVPAKAVAATLDGQPFSLADRKGSWLAINFFATTCVPCVAEHAELVRFADAQAQLPLDQRTELISVVYNDSTPNVRSFFAERGGGTWPVLQDDQLQIAVAFGVAKVPETWLVDPNGVIRRRIISTVNADSLEAEIVRLRATP